VTPVLTNQRPVVATLAELNERLAAIDEAEDERFVHGSLTSIGHNFAVEREHLLPLPADAYDTGLDLCPTVHRNGRITVRQSYYSVPARFIGQRVRVSLRANEVVVFDGARQVARHPRLTRRYDYHDILDHYLEVLLVKPGAFAGAAALAAARAEGSFTAAHEAFWAAARQAHGEREGTRALIEVLLLHRQLPAAAVIAGVEAVLRAKAASFELVAIEARKALEEGIGAHEAADHVDGEAATGDGAMPPAGAQDKDEAVPGPPRARVISLLARLPADARPVPSIAKYDRLLKRRPTTEGTA